MDGISNERRNGFDFLTMFSCDHGDLNSPICLSHLFTQESKAVTVEMPQTYFAPIWEFLDHNSNGMYNNTIRCITFDVVGFYHSFSSQKNPSCYVAAT